MTDKPVLTLKDLSIEFPTPQGVVQAVKNLDLTVEMGRRVGFIGESGSGKTTTALAVMQMLAEPGRVSGGTIDLGGTDVLALTPEQMRQARLSRVAYIPQGAMNSLNPVMRVENQLWDGVVAHEGKTDAATLLARSEEALSSVGLPGHVGRLYPHELSGGMKQRVCIALGMILRPELIIADEPTSALDVVTQRQVMLTLKDVQSKIGSGLILIGHDMGLMAQSVDELAVLKDGELVEHGTVQQIIENPQHPYTQDLISSVPLVGGDSFLNPAARAAAPERDSQEPLLRFDNVSKRYGDVTALHPLSFTLQGDTPQIISIVGQSGSGKSTMGSIMLGFNPPSTGRVLFEGHDLQKIGASETLRFRKNIQAVFQDPYACFNPFYRVRHALRYPFKRFGLARDEAHIQEKMEEACAAVGLDPGLVLPRYPHQLSGGQRQRLIVARALMLSPKLLIADEPVSMVDASLRASILSNIYDLKDKYGISILYITHDLATAYHVSDYVMVLFKGHVVEAGPPKQVIGDPQHPYTQLLINSIPWPDLQRSWGGGQLGPRSGRSPRRQGRSPDARGCPGLQHGGFVNHDLRFTAAKIGQRLNLIRPYVFRQRVELPPFRMCELADAAQHPPLGADPSGWEDIQPESYWGRADLNFFMTSQITVPSGWDASALALHLPLGTFGDIFNHPEALVQIDGTPIGSADRYHHTIALPESLSDDQPHRLDLHGWTGHTQWPPDPNCRAKLFMGRPALVVRDTGLQSFITLAETVLDTCNTLPTDNAEREGLLDALDAAFLVLDTRAPLADAFYASVPDAMRCLQDGIAQAGAPLDVTLHGIGHAHMDIAYLWPIDQIRRKNARTYSNVPATDGG